MKNYGKTSVKFEMKKLIFSLFISFASINSYGQDSILNYLTLTDNNHESILIRWEIKSGNTCNGIEIQHSTDSVNFTTIHYIVGVCGNNSSPTAYQYEDLNPISNSKNYYRIKLGLANPTRAECLFFVKLNADGYFLYPNPSNSSCIIYFKNKYQDAAKVSLVNSSGQIIHQETVNTEFVSLNLSNLPLGPIFFSIDVNGIYHQGKIIKN